MHRIRNPAYRFTCTEGSNPSLSTNNVPVSLANCMAQIFKIMKHDLRCLMVFLFLFLGMNELVFAKRLALVIGNDNYLQVTKLLKAGNDASAMATEFRKADFEVTLHKNLNYFGLLKAIDEFTNKISGGDEVVFFYAGHGVQLKTGNYILPIDIEPDNESRIEKTAYSLGDLSDKFSESKPKFTLMIVDACRNNPLSSNKRAIGATRGLSPIEPAKGQMIVFSASKGQEALDRISDSDPNPNTVFTREFISQMRKPGINIEQIVHEVQDAVEEMAKKIGHEQRPALHNEARGHFYFFGPPTNPTTPLASVSPPPLVSQEQREDNFWNDAKAAGIKESFQAYIDAYPRGRYVNLAKANITRLSNNSQAQIPQPAPPQSPTAVPAPSTSAPTANASGSPAVRWRLISSFPKSLDILYGASTHFAKGVSDRTGGNFQISVHAAGEIAPAQKTLETVQDGLIELGHIFPHWYVQKDAAWGMGDSQLFGVNSSASDSWLTSDAGRKEFQRYTQTYNLVSFPMGVVMGDVQINANSSFSTLKAWWCRKPINSLSDLKGLKVRLGGNESAIWTHLGVIPMATPGGDMYPALERNEIDCAQFYEPYDDKKLGLFKVAPFLMVFNTNISARSSLQNQLIVNADSWRTLPDAYRVAIQEAAADTQNWMRDQFASANPIAVKSLIENGTKIKVMPKDVVDALRNAAVNEYESQAKNNPEFARLYRAWQRSKQR